MSSHPGNHLSGAIVAALCVAAAVVLATGSKGDTAHAPRRTADSTCAACGNFYEYANKAWLDTATIPPSMSDWGAWSANDRRVFAQLRAILDAAAAERFAAAPRPAQRTAAARTAVDASRNRILGEFFASCMDGGRTDRDGLRPLEPALARIAAIAKAADIAPELGRLHRDGVPAAFGFSSEVDRVGDLHFTATAQQGGLILRGTGLYFNNDSTTASLRDAYLAHVARTFGLAGESAADARRDAERVMAIEIALAKASMTRLQLAEANVKQMYRRYSLAELAALTPGFSWDAYLHERHAAPPKSVIVPQPAFFTAVARLLNERPVEEWRAYLRWHLLTDASPFLSAPFVDESAAFDRRLSGARVSPPRSEQCVKETSADLPEQLGRAYAARTFSASSKARINEMVTRIRAELVDKVRRVPWMTGETRSHALIKAKSFGVKIGYPDRWHDDSALRISDGSFVTGRAEARRYESDRMMARIGGAPNPAEWDFHGFYYFLPQSPTAWANWNEILFPAAYLQPPIYDSTADLATNYGAVGVVIGHEMTHLFTADGADIDEAGRIRHWWSAADSARFAAIQRLVVRQYDAYTVLDSATHINGSLTFDENLADIGGVELAYAALERALAGQPRHEKTDTTAEQRFFLSYARSRVSKSRPEYLRQQVASDGHAPSEARVNGPLSDFVPFCKAFGCKPGDAMMRPDSERVHIW